MNSLPNGMVVTSDPVANAYYSRGIAYRKKGHRNRHTLPDCHPDSHFLQTYIPAPQAATR